MSNLKTTKEVAVFLGEKVGRVRSVINYREIAPTAYASTIKLFDAAKVDLIKSYLYNLQIRGH